MDVMESHPLLVLILVVGGVLVAAGIVWAVLRHLHAKQFTDRGWTYERDPFPAVAFGLNRPPFGQGYRRRVHELVTGEAASGAPFQAFKYSSDADDAAGYVVTMPLPRALPAFVARRPGALPSGSRGTPVTAEEGFVALADDEGFGDAVLQFAGGPLRALVADRGVSVTIDGARVVASPCGDTDDAVAALVERLTPVAEALAASELGQWPAPFVPAGYAFTEHPHWTYIDRDDDMLTRVSHSASGYDHRALDIVLSGGEELALIAMRHEWKTQRTVTSTGANGQTSSRTVVDQHSEHIMEIVLPFPFVDLSVNKFWDWGSGRVRFESDDFNRQFAVRCNEPRFASNVFHPRMMGWLQQVEPPPFEVKSGRLYADHDGDFAALEWWMSFATAFFGRVPEFVWKNLGVRAPALMMRHEG